MLEVNRNPGPAELHEFGAAMLLGFGVIGAILWYFGPEPNAAAWTGAREQIIGLVAWALGLGLLAASFGPVSVARPVYVGWMRGATAIGAVMTVVMLSVLFFVLLPVFSLIRLKDPMRRKLRGSGETYWENHDHHESTLERTIRPC